jgi:hypothetical protein
MENSSSNRNPPTPGRERDLTRRGRIMARDAGLDLISRTNRWMVAGAIGVAGAVSLYASNAFHPQTARSATSAPASSATQSSTNPTQSSTNPSQTSTNPGLQSSTAPVQATPAPAPVISGGS